MAVLYESLENYEKAIEYARKTLAINTRILPANHADFAPTYANLAIALYHHHQLEAASEYMTRACQIQEKNPEANQWITLEYLEWSLRIEKALLEKDQVDLKTDLSEKQ